jgi:hypothetical protein
MAQGQVSDGLGRHERSVRGDGRLQLRDGERRKGLELACHP